MLHYLNKLKKKVITLGTDGDWEMLAKDLESGNHNKQKNLFKFYKRVREMAKCKEHKWEGVLKYLDMEAVES
ncbi:MAG: hypothetical protein J6P21_03745 [Clostridia bacterium]|nr:hypothetical protein [Clostridia bacterium]